VILSKTPLTTVAKLQRLWIPLPYRKLHSWYLSGKQWYAHWGHKCEMLYMRNYVHVFAPIFNIVSIAQLCNDE
jgi:hypothetical protein